MRIMVVGAGFGETHLRWLSNIPDASIVVLCYQQNREHARLLADKYKIRQVSSDPDAVLAAEDLDAMVVVTPPATHENLIMKGVSAGLRVSTDKPLAVSVQAAQRLSEVAISNPGNTMITYQWRANPTLCHLRSMCERGILGDLMQAELEFYDDFLSGPETKWPWRHDLSVAGAGVLGDLGVHLFDLLRWLFPRNWVVTAGTTILAKSHREYQGKAITCQTEDLANILLTDEIRSAAARVTVSRVSIGFREIRVIVHGSSGTAKAFVSPEDGSGRLVTFTTNRESPAVVMFGPDLMNPYWGFTSGLPGIADFTDGCAAQLLLDQAINRSKQVMLGDPREIFCEKQSYA